MPCWTVQSNTVSLVNPDAALLTQALTALGFRVNDAEYSRPFGATLTADRYADGMSVKVLTDGTVQVTSRDQSADLVKLGNEVKRAYSVEVVQSAAKRFGWTMKKETASKFVAQRRF